MLKAPDIFLLCLALLLSTSGCSEELGSVDTKFNLLSPDDSIRLHVFDDPKISGVSCYLSATRSGGMKGALGIAEDSSDASIDCRQVDEITIREPLRKAEPVFKQRRSLIFKTLQVIRFCDTARNSIVYLVYSDKVIEGSPQNSVSAVPIARWSLAEQSTPLAKCEYRD